jgi:hypothetical protein
MNGIDWAGSDCRGRSSALARFMHSRLPVLQRAACRVLCVALAAHGLHSDCVPLSQLATADGCGIIVVAAIEGSCA